MDAGGLAQMTYNNQNSLGGGLGMPASGFGSRGKGGNIKRLSVPSPAAIENNSAPRTSRSHLLAGLRTAPKSPSFPSSAPPNQLHQPAFGDSHLSPLNAQYKQPKTAMGKGFNGYQNQFNNNLMGQLYSPEQILAPPTLQLGDNADGAMDPHVYEELMRTNQYLAQQQMRLQQQLIQVTAAAQQFQNMNLGQNQGVAYGQPNLSVYNQQLSQGVQPLVQPVPGSPGLFTVYNPLTGQTSFAFDNGAAEGSPDGAHSAADFGQPQVPAFRASVSGPTPQQPPSPVNRSNNWRSASPPKISTTPPRDEALPLPPPSVNAFRTGHRKNNLSLANSNAAASEAPRTGGLKSGVFPRTPMTGTFGPGQAQEGEHPVRQPRGPPSMEDLVSKPTTKHEGSKNFASRQRRSAVKNLVRAGIERRGNRSTGSIHSADSGSPTSEHGASLSNVSDGDDVSVRSGSASLEGKPALDKTPSPNVGVIGAERKELRERSSERQSTDCTAASVSSDDEAAIGGRLVEVKIEAAYEAERKNNLQLLASAEKRRLMF